MAQARKPRKKSEELQPEAPTVYGKVLRIHYFGEFIVFEVGINPFLTINVQLNSENYMKYVKETVGNIGNQDISILWAQFTVPDPQNYLFQGLLVYPPNTDMLMLKS
jgi:hypothetical protein